MSPLDFLRLFRAILSSGAKVDAAAIERMGLLAVKIAQMYAVRSDLLGPGKVRGTLPPAATHRAALDSGV